MDNAKKIVLVPWDFTEGSENALLHAIQLAVAGDNEIMLVHIIPRSLILHLLGRKSDGKEFHEAKKRLETVAEEVFVKQGIKPQTLVMEGRSKRLVKELITEVDVNLIVSNSTYKYQNDIILATDFLRNMVVKEFTVPFIIIDSPPAHNHYIEIVVPVDYDRKYKETLHWIIYLSKYYKCNINLIKPYFWDEGKKKHMAANIYFTKKMLDGNKIIYGIKTAKKKSNFREEVFRFAHNIDADLVLIMADKYEMYVQESKKANVSIPLMCVNPRIKKYQSFN
jgi:hypothetical protein